MKKIVAGDLSVAYLDQGPKDGLPVILLHGFPYDVTAYEGVVPHLADAGLRCFVPYLRGYGPTRFLSASTPRSGQQAALAHDLLALMDALDIPAAILGGYDWGGRAATIVSALWPERAIGLVSCGTGYNLQDIPNAWKPGPPEMEERFWYQYYFHTRRGAEGLARNRFDLCRHIWSLWSPTWAFEAGVYERAAASFENPDFVEVVLHSYRHRYGDVPGDPRFEATEALLAAQPDVTVPAVVLQGTADGVDPPSQEDRDRVHFTGPYRRTITPDVGHNYPQEAPAQFAEAVLSLV